MYLFLAFSNPFAHLLDPIVAGLQFIIARVNDGTHNLGWSLVLVAIGIRVVLWPLNAMQYKSMVTMQAMQPKLRAIQEKHRDNPQAMSAAQMAVYKEHGTNPVAGCLPVLVQLPILFSIYRAIIGDRESFGQTHLLWIGSAISAKFPHILASSLADPDYVLLALYVVSMFFSVRLSSPPTTDPQQAQMQQTMSLVSPLIIAFVGRSWPSGLMLFWLTTNIMTMLQQFIMIRRHGTQSAVAAAVAGTPKIIDVPRAAKPVRDAADSPRRRSKGSRRA